MCQQGKELDPEGQHWPSVDALVEAMEVLGAGQGANRPRPKPALKRRNTTHWTSAYQRRRRQARRHNLPPVGATVLSSYGLID